MCSSRPENNSDLITLEEFDKRVKDRLDYRGRRNEIHLIREFWPLCLTARRFDYATEIGLLMQFVSMLYNSISGNDDTLRLDVRLINLFYRPFCIFSVLCMYVHACIYVCLFVCIYVCACIVYMFVWFVCMVCMYACMHICLY